MIDILIILFTDICINSSVCDRLCIGQSIDSPSSIAKTKKLLERASPI